MASEEILQLIKEVQTFQSEFENIEVKTALGGTPKRLFEPLTAFANKDGGGVILFGLDESKDFEIVGIGDLQRLQEEITHLASSEIEPPLRLDFAIEIIDGKTIVVVEVPEIPILQRPCYYKPAGVNSGSYIRVGNTNRQMTGYEIFSYFSNREQPIFDENVIREATIDDLNQNNLTDFVDQLRRSRTKVPYLNLPYEQILKTRRVIKEVDGVLRPTLAGLLMFGIYPQQYEPQFVITFLQYYGTTEEELAPNGERFLDNRKFEGTAPEIIEQAVNHVLASIRKSSLIEGLWRRDIPEYPIVAVREAVANAVAHRDHSNYARGSYIQIRLFADRLEIQSPGGLYGNVSVDNIEDEQSTRNRTLMQLMEDYQLPGKAPLIENRGTGIRSMLRAMRSATLEPPRFQDKRTSFWVVFYNHTLMNSEAVTWLNQFANYPLSDQQRFALVYLRNKEKITNSDYQRLNFVDSVNASHALRGLVQAGLIEQHNTRRWTYYTLQNNDFQRQNSELSVEEEAIVQYTRSHGSVSNSECCDLLDILPERAWYLLRKLTGKRILFKKGGSRWTRYYL